MLFVRYINSDEGVFSFVAFFNINHGKRMNFLGMVITIDFPLLHDENHIVKQKRLSFYKGEVNMDHGFLSLIPPLLALFMVIITRRVLLSLGVGIIVGALMVNQTSETIINDSMMQILTYAVEIFYVDGAVNTWEFFIILFLLLLGIIATMVTITGGSQAFGEWALSKVKTRVGAQFVSTFLGLVIFIDDYFNSLTVGNVSRPFTDRHRVSRAKLAYIVDSTSAPICVISPVSSWGAYIITILAGIFATHGVTQYGPLQAFIYMIPMNYYAIFAFLLVLAVAYFKLDIGPMRTHELRAIKTGELVDPEKGEAAGDTSKINVLVDGKIGDLVYPIAVLFGVTILFMFITGIQGTEGKVTILTIFENTDVARSLLYGGSISVIVAIIIAAIRRVKAKDIVKGVFVGIRSMLPAVNILIFAWVIIGIIDDLGTGTYLASLVDEHINLGFLPVLLFLIACIMALSTGTSWGTFGIMLPIAAEIATTTDVDLLLPVMAAVLAGAIFGDHVSPISDTTILSSAGTGSHLIDHVITQLPYAIIVAVIAAIGYLILGFTQSIFLSLLATLAIFALFILLIKLFIKVVY